MAEYIDKELVESELKSRAFGKCEVCGAREHCYERRGSHKHCWKPLQFPTADVVPVELLEKWLYEIAMNNVRNYLGDGCEEIIQRLPGLRKFVEEYNGRVYNTEAP